MASLSAVAQEKVRLMVNRAIYDDATKFMSLSNSYRPVFSFFFSSPDRSTTNKTLPRPKLLTSFIGKLVYDSPWHTARIKLLK